MAGRAVEEVVAEPSGVGEELQDGDLAGGIAELWSAGVVEPVEDFDVVDVRDVFLCGVGEGDFALFEELEKRDAADYFGARPQEDGRVGFDGRGGRWIRAVSCPERVLVEDLSCTVEEDGASTGDGFGVYGRLEEAV